jgi:hypothetical protein
MGSSGYEEGGEDGYDAEAHPDWEVVNLARG